MIVVREGKVVTKGDRSTLRKEVDALRQYLKSLDRREDKVDIDGLVFRADDIICTEYQGHCAFFHLADGRRRKVRIKQCDLERKLLRFEPFAVLCRGVIVNTAQVRWIADGEVMMNNGDCYPVSGKRVNTLSEKTVRNQYSQNCISVWTSEGMA